jgi:AcrR family transcriptional regulator
LFIERGIQETTLADIAREMGVARSTIYQYFANQADIAWAILEDFFQAFQQEITDGQHFRADQTGYEQIEDFLGFLLQALSRQPEAFRFLAQFDVMYAGTQESERLLATARRTLGSAVEPLVEAVRKGKGDGSLHADLDPQLTASAVVNMALAMCVRLEAHRPSITIEYRQTPEQIFTEACRLLLRGMRAS